MFRPMRRKNQELPHDECELILNKATSGVLALSGDDDYPYAVPLSYVYDNGKIYFHCAKTGHKIDAISRNEKASFCVIDQDLIIPEKFTTYFRSVIVFGKIRILTDENEKRLAIEKLAKRYAPNIGTVERQKAIDMDYAPLCMLELSIEHISGKESKELAKNRKQTAEEV